VKRAGRDNIEAVPDRVILLKNAGASAQAPDEANFGIKQSAVVRGGRGIVGDRINPRVFGDRDDLGLPGRSGIRHA
jgi:hypothetical protein